MTKSIKNIKLVVSKKLTTSLIQGGNNMTIDKKLIQLRQTKGLSQGDVAKKIGVSRPAYGFWEKGTTKPRVANLMKLAELFDIALTELTEDKKEELINIYDSLTTTRQDKILSYTKTQQKEQIHDENTPEIRDLFPHRVYEKLSAGGGFGYFDDGTYDIVYSDKAYDYDFASWVFGDSMEPQFQNGSVALIRDTTFDYDGAVYAIEWDGQTYIKHVYKEATGLRLVSANPKYKDKFAPFDESPRIIGKIIGNFIPIEKES